MSVESIVLLGPGRQWAKSKRFVMPFMLITPVPLPSASYDWHKMKGMIDHLTLMVRDMGRSVDFYSRALAPLGYVAKAHHEPTIGFGVADDGLHSDFYLTPAGSDACSPLTHIAFRASDASVVDAFYREAIAAGGRGNGVPGPRDYHPGYYSAFVLDPDGINVEAVVDWSGLRA